MSDDCKLAVLLVQVKLQPMRINSTQPSLARSFVEQQISVLQQLSSSHPQQLQQQHQQGAEDEQLQTKEHVSLRKQAFLQVQEKMGAELQKAGCVWGAA